MVLVRYSAPDRQGQPARSSGTGYLTYRVQQQIHGASRGEGAVEGGQSTAPLNCALQNTEGPSIPGKNAR